jgi:hypothetical protein
MTARTARLVSLAALLPLLVVAAAGVGYDRLRCRATGLVETATAEGQEGGGCCPAEESPATPVVRDARCCDRETAAVSHPPAEPNGAHGPFEVLAPLALVTLLPPPTPAATNLARAAKTTRPPPTPLRVIKQSFLI